MKVIHFSKIKKVDKEIVIGIGKFDGVHLGHKKILMTVSEEAKKKGRVPAVVTFKNFPVEFLLCRWEEKLSLLEKSGIRLCIWSDFDEMSHISHKEFVDILIKAGVKTIVVGYNFHFGKGRKGNIEFLRKMAEKKNFSVIVVPPYKKRGKAVSASLIRKAIKNGDIQTANTLLGRYFSISGKVIKGRGIGKKLGFPTANLDLKNNISIGKGVYAGWAVYNKKVYKAAITIGASPTFIDNTEKFEVFLIDFPDNKNLYNQQLRVFFYKKLRPQKKFKNQIQLQQQIKKDIGNIRYLLTSAKITI
ncbi:MAG: bifunctional riboflavin kinase/FAD synthetase [Candidatus Ratteibacteria bacterium]|nr:bifunctional riboflavin kinase/FAD synthetase [Candidatus Ratteibacteria bacterium]